MRIVGVGALGVLGSLLALMASCGGARDAATDPGAVLGDSLIDAWTRAAGGEHAWNAVRSARYTVTTVWFDTTGAIRRMRPRRVELRRTKAGEEARVKRPEAEGLYVQGFNGDTAWALLNGRPLPAADPAAAEAEYVARDLFYWFGLPFKLWDDGVHRSGRELDSGGYEVRVSFGEDIGAHPGDVYLYYFLDADPFPEEVHYIEQGKTSRNRTLWTEFGQAGPLVYVATRRWLDANNRPTKELRIDDVQLNPRLADSLFTPPSWP